MGEKGEDCPAFRAEKQGAVTQGGHGAGRGQGGESGSNRRCHLETIGHQELEGVVRGDTYWTAGKVLGLEWEKAKKGTRKEEM